MESPQGAQQLTAAQWIADALVSTAVIDGRELRFSAGWNAPSVSVALRCPVDRTVWLATVLRLGRCQHGWPVEPVVRSNFRFAEWIGVDDFDCTKARETVRKAAEGHWIAVNPAVRHGYYQH